MEIIDGKALAKKIREGLKIEVDELKKNGIVPKLAVIMVGDDKASSVYVRNKSKACDEIGIEFEDGVIGHISDSWITPRKHVTLLVRGTKATAILDDTVPENKLVVYDNFEQNATKNITTPDVLEIEPLKLECQHFISCCETGKKARSDGDNGFMVTQILEEAEKIMLGERVKKLDEVNFALSRMKK